MSGVPPGFRVKSDQVESPDLWTPWSAAKGRLIDPFFKGLSAIGGLRPPSRLSSDPDGSRRTLIQRALPFLIGGSSRCLTTRRGAISPRPPNSPGGDVLKREPLVWVASPNHAPERRDPLPLSLYPRNACVFRERATQALNAAGRDWRAIYTSKTLLVQAPAERFSASPRWRNSVIRYRKVEAVSGAAHPLQTVE